MGTLDEIKRMHQEGASEQEIISSLKGMGLSGKEISNAIAQARIKDAVSEPQAPSPNSDEELSSGEEATPSIMNQPQQFSTQEMQQEPEDLFVESQAPSPEQAQLQAPSEEQEQPYYQAPSGYPQNYQQYAPQPSMSADTISEIAEQVVAEKFYPVAKELEKIIDMKTTIDAKLAYLDERLRRIEAIIDKLQMSVLQRMTEYVSDVRDMKTELAETQKSFKSLSGSAHKK